MTSTPRQGVSRRHAIVAAASGGVAASLLPTTAIAQTSNVTGARQVNTPEEETRVDTPLEAIVATRAGRVRGYRRNGIFTYKGIPYGAPTGGAARFLPPSPVSGWDGVRDTVAFGSVSPHPPRRDWGQQQTQFVYDWDDGYEGEDCLNLNVWSGALDPAAKRPVMVWIHGGGFTSGSSHELPSYDGENLAKRGVILVSVNHRLGPLGFMDLSSIGGDRYRRSGNVSMLDLVLALEWVRDNIAAFGGDPNSVTIFGQSGGGAKVSALMTMPAAKGLFHRAIVQSGSFSSAASPAEARTMAIETMKQLGLEPGDIEGLTKVPFRNLISAGDAAAARLSSPPQLFNLGRAVRLPRIGWGPVFDGDVFPEVPWADGAPAASRDVPLIVGTTREEFRDPTTWGIEWPELERRLAEGVGAAAPGVLSAFRAAFPTENASGIAGIIGGMTWRRDALAQCDKKAKQGGAPVYNYWFTWQPPVFEGRPGAFHCLDLAFCFDNTARCDQATGNTLGARALAAQMSQAWIEFAATGRPGPTWKAYAPDARQTMVFGDTAHLELDPAGKALRSLA